MTDQRSRPSFPVPPSAFKGFRFPPEVILLAVRWYLRFGLSYRDVQGANALPIRQRVFVESDSALVGCQSV